MKRMHRMNIKYVSLVLRSNSKYNVFKAFQFSQ